MNVEYVARESLASWRPAQQKRNLTIDRRMLGEIVDHRRTSRPPRIKCSAMAQAA